MKLITGLATTAVTGLAVLFLESEREMHSFRVNRYKLQIPGLSGHRLLFVTDYHEAVGGKLNPGLLGAAKRLKPDMILIGGDMVNGKHPKEDVTPAVELINGLADIAPVVYAYGNHECRMEAMTGVPGYDWDGYRERLDRRVRFLRNEQLTVNLGQQAVRIYGLDMYARCYYRNRGELHVEDIEKLLGKRDHSKPAILLAHDPSWFHAYTEWGADLTLSGHYHGGIIRLPVLGGIINPKYQLFPKYDYGVYEENGRIMLVGSGLGQHTIPVRWFNTPELVLLDFE